MPTNFERLYAPPVIEWSALMPVIGVIITGVLALIIEMARPKRNNNLIAAVSLAGLGISGIYAARMIADDSFETFADMVVNDRFGGIMQLLLIGVCGLTLLFSEGYLREKRIPFGEFYPLVLWSTAGAMLMVSTKNMLMVFLGLEILSIALYVLAGMSRNETKSEESALKYFLLGAFASAFLLYGIALIYGATGSLHYDAIAKAWDAQNAPVSGLLMMGLGLSLIGFCFKSAFVPFHQWTPDVYQGAPTNVTAFMAAGSKIAAIAALYRFLEASIPMRDLWLPALSWIAILTMLIGNLVALVQKDVKRILGYSSIAHAGYILVALLAHFNRPEEIGIGTLVYYLVGYSLMTIGAFAVLTVVVKRGKEGTRIQDLNGLWRRNPAAALLLLVFMVSLIGIPPTAGFIGKLQIFFDAVRADLLPLAIVLAVSSAISVYYYLGVALAVFVKEPTEDEVPIQKFGIGNGLAVAICAAGIFLIAFLYGPVTNSLVGSPERPIMTAQSVAAEVQPQ
jgi:NADH-quinone oxidoreductase subunit N